jgi:hypothetical protein
MFPAHRVSATRDKIGGRPIVKSEASVVIADLAVRQPIQPRFPGGAAIGVPVRRQRL